MNIILYGGGLDSTALIPYLVKVNGLDPDSITLLHIDYGQKATEAESEAATFWAERYGLHVHFSSIDLSWSGATIMAGTEIGTAETNRLELRNPLLLSYAAAYGASHADDVNIFLGFHVEPEGSGFLDAKVEYLTHMAAALGAATDRHICIHIPFSHMTRKEILLLGLQHDHLLADRSHTCYETQTCGQCVHCVQKSEMLKELEGQY